MIIGHIRFLSRLHISAVPMKRTHGAVELAAELVATPRDGGARDGQPAEFVVRGTSRRRCVDAKCALRRRRSAISRHEGREMRAMRPFVFISCRLYMAAEREREAMMSWRFPAATSPTARRQLSPPLKPPRRHQVRSLLRRATFSALDARQRKPYRRHAEFRDIASRLLSCRPRAPSARAR